MTPGPRPQPDMAFPDDDSPAEARRNITALLVSVMALLILAGVVLLLAWIVICMVVR